MKLLIILNYRPNQGGITGQIDELAKCLTNEGWKITMVSTHGNVWQRVQGIMKAIIYSFRCERILGVGAAYLGFFPIIVAAIVANISFRKIVFNFHDGQAQKFLREYLWLVRIVIGRNPVVCASAFVAQCFKEKGFAVLEIPNHFQFRENHPPWRSKFDWNNKIVWARSFKKLYQPEMALQAASKALKQNRHLEFHFFGDGPLLKSLKSKYAQPGIIYHGFIPRERLLERYREYSIMINTTCFDNFPLSIVEAGFSQMCVLTTRIGGIATIYRNDEVLFFSDVEELVDKILDFAKHPHDFVSFRNKLHKKVVDFTWTNVRESWLRCLS